jgi:hypothetical protein
MVENWTDLTQVLLLELNIALPQLVFRGCVYKIPLDRKRIIITEEDFIMVPCGRPVLPWGAFILIEAGNSRGY